jgi:hypothetical protein
VSIQDRHELIYPTRWVWPILLKEHFDSSQDTGFRLLLPIEELMEQLNQFDYSHRWILPATVRVTCDLIECLEAHVNVHVTLDGNLWLIFHKRYL